MRWFIPLMKLTIMQKIGGACAFAITIAATESAAKAENKQFFQMISGKI